MPVVLRPMEKEEEERETLYYRFIGVCYLEGAMFGEAVSWAEDDAHVLKLI